MQKIFLCLVFVLMSILKMHAQITSDSLTNVQVKKNQKGSADKIWNLDVLLAVDHPMADMGKRFGTSYRIGFGIKRKTANNWIWGIKGEFIIGNKIKEDSLLINVKTKQGGVISQQGDLLNVGIFERGYMLGAQIGKVFPYLQLNKNSGPVMIASVGFLQHKIKLFDRDLSFPQLREEYKKGYDRLTNGLYLQDFIGYQYFAKDKLINFYAGFDFVWGLTQGRRTYQFDIARADTQSRNDLLVGFKFGWVLPIYKKNVEEIYY